MSNSEKGDVLELGKLLGRLETAEFFGNISEVTTLAAYENIKKSKAWKNFSDKNGNAFPNVDEFCRAKLGYSSRRLEQLVSNRALIGQEAFEQAERMGLRQVDYNAIKTLPAPDQELVRRAVEDATSRDEVLDLLQELAARHAKEKEVLTAKVADLSADNAATEKLLAHKNAKIDEYSRQIERATPDDVLAGLHRELAGIMSEAVVAVQGQLRQGFVAVTRHHESHGGDSRQVLSGYVAQLQQHLHALRDEFMLSDTLSDGIPAWQKWANEQEANVGAPSLAS